MKEIKIIEKNLAPIVKNALALKIESEFDLGTGVEILSALNKYQDMITEEKEKITKPALELLKVERARWKPVETMYQSGIDWVRDQMSTYRTNLVKKQNEKEQQMAQDIIDGKIDMNKALANLDEEIETKITTPLGSVTFRQTQFLKITDASLIPRDYFDLNEKRLFDAMKSGVVVAGAEIEVRSIPVNKR